MQERACEKRGEQFLLIKSLPASGKSRALMFIALDKLQHQSLKQAIIVVPEKAIGASFHGQPLTNSVSGPIGACFCPILVGPTMRRLTRQRDSSSSRRLMAEFCASLISSMTILPNVTAYLSLKDPAQKHNRDYVDIIIALGMAKEGFDWIWCDHALTVGYRSSLTEIVQITGRVTRDAPGKIRARFTNLIAEEISLDR
jgi:hypothetical protein